MKQFNLQRIESRPWFSGCDNYQRVKITGIKHLTAETKLVCERIKEMLELREEYVLKQIVPGYDLDQCTGTKVIRKDLPGKLDMKLIIKDGVFQLENSEEYKRIISAEKFFEDLRKLTALENDGETKTLSYTRNAILVARFDLHILLNEDVELEETKKVSHRDFYNVYKVDNHIHHSACMNQKHFLRFVKNKIKTEGNYRVVKDSKKGFMTLGEVMDEIGIKVQDLSIDSLDMHAHKQTYHRFDKFNKKYNPVGSSLLRTIFLKTSNDIDGRYLAEITHEVFDGMEKQKYQCTELRLSIYGKSINEWSELANWVVNNELYCKNNVWMIQIPRLYEVFKSLNILDSFEDMLTNIFKPIFEVTLNPRKNPNLFKFLQLMCGFDTVDDESIPEKQIYDVKPSDWKYSDNPPYAVYCYYIYANIASLNILRKRRNLNTFTFRPHSGEAGNIEHLSTAFLLANSINHGVNLKKSPLLCYLYYLAQIGISVSPLSNNILFVKHQKHPFPTFFKMGLNVTLSTDDPLLIHYTKDPLIEEYSIAAQVWNLSKTDLSEIAMNSVYQSGFDERIKEQWLGEKHSRLKIYKNMCTKVNLPETRVAFRREILEEEFNFINGSEYE